MVRMTDVPHESKNVLFRRSCDCIRSQPNFYYKKSDKSACELKVLFLVEKSPVSIFKFHKHMQDFVDFVLQKCVELVPEVYGKPLDSIAAG